LNLKDMTRFRLLDLGRCAYRLSANRTCYRIAGPCDYAATFPVSEKPDAAQHGQDSLRRCAVFVDVSS
jgi:hypothetical protein